MSTMAPWRPTPAEAREGFVWSRRADETRT